MAAFYIIRSRPNGLHWQTSRGFQTRDPKDATKYSSREEAEKAALFCCPPKANAEVVSLEGGAQ
jgi:hypothetical protein